MSVLECKKHAVPDPDMIRHSLGWHFPDWSYFELKLIIPGEPCVLKNSKQIVRFGKRPALIAANRTRSWLRIAIHDLHKQWTQASAHPIPMRVLVNAAFRVYMASKRRIDLSNAIQAPEDALQAAGVIENDYQIASFDGSRRLYDKQNPRVEITITPYRGE